MYMRTLKALSMTLGIRLLSVWLPFRISTCCFLGSQLPSHWHRCISIAYIRVFCRRPHDCGLQHADFRCQLNFRTTRVRHPPLYRVNHCVFSFRSVCWRSVAQWLSHPWAAGVLFALGAPGATTAGAGTAGTATATCTAPPLFMPLCMPSHLQTDNSE